MRKLSFGYPLGKFGEHSNVLTIKNLELLSAAPRASLTLPSCCASITRVTYAKHEPIFYSSILRNKNLRINPKLTPKFESFRFIESIKYSVFFIYFVAADGYETNREVVIKLIQASPYYQRLLWCKDDIYY